MVHYTYGIKGTTDGRVYLYNLNEAEARRIEQLNPKLFKVAKISMRNCPLRDGNDRVAQHKKDVERGCTPLMIPSELEETITPLNSPSMIRELSSALAVQL